MQHDKASKLEESWGNKPCDHPKFDKEYFLGSATGDWVCTQCGRAFMPETKDEIVRKRPQTKANQN
jgi:hypothetical protein